MGIYIGGTGSANHQDDYEEGTFTPTLYYGSGTSQPSYSWRYGYYIKVGAQVTVWFNIGITGFSPSNTQKVYILEDRGILYINGPDSEKFLQNLISNDVEKVNESKSCFASLLSPQGKFLFDFIVVKHKDGYFLDCEKRIVDQLYKKLAMYKIKSKVEILNLSN